MVSRWTLDASRYVWLRIDTAACGLVCVLVCVLVCGLVCVLVCVGWCVVQDGSQRDPSSSSGPQRVYKNRVVSACPQSYTYHHPFPDSLVFPSVAHGCCVHRLVTLPCSSRRTPIYYLLIVPHDLNAHSFFFKWLLLVLRPRACTRGLFRSLRSRDSMHYRVRPDTTADCIA